MAKKYGIQLRGLGRALKPRGPGVLRPKPTDRYGQQMKPKPIRPGKKDGGRAGTEEGQRRAKPKSRKLGRGIGGKSFTRDLLKGADNLRKVKVGDLTIAFKDGGIIDKKKKKEQKESEKGTKPKDLIYAPKKMERLKQLREELGMKKGGKAKFPDLSGDGKVTKKDVLMGRGVIPRKVKDLKPGTVDTAKKAIKKGKQ